MNPILHKSAGSRLALALGMLAATTAFLAAADDPHQAHAGQNHGVPSALVRIVRESNRSFVDVNATAPAGYQPLFRCVTGQDRGAMGIHYVNLQLVGDGKIDVLHPEALIYEQTVEGLRLVGVEFLVDAATWMAHHDSPPSLDQNLVYLFVNITQ
ncbi:MAG: hypothetical protein J0H49_30800 [Acidobacteria bacterium]|nr:hypothetical protein [Acidobacteriota bacterium]